MNILTKLLTNNRIISNYKLINILNKIIINNIVINNTNNIYRNRNFSTYCNNSDKIVINWKRRDGNVIKTYANIGANLLRQAQKEGIELEGACEGVCACSTCHVILEEDIYNNLPEAEEIEEDMLDQAVGLTITSRLACQIIITKEHNNMLVTLPAATRNFYVDGHVPKPH